MRNFREFEAGPDPFGRTWRVYFKWLQTGITLRHADTVDVKFVVEYEGQREEKIIALPHPGLLALSKATGHRLTDAWCSRLAALHLKHMIETGEDIEKRLVTVSDAEMAAYDAQLTSDGAMAA
jgi:hypothetical protein